MRVIGGEFRSRRLKTIPGLATRPTPDRLRETLFNVLVPRIAGAVFLDAYAGTGAVGIEALSPFLREGDRLIPGILVAVMHGAQQIFSVADRLGLDDIRCQQGENQDESLHLSWTSR